MTTSGLEEDFHGFKESFLAEAEEHLSTIEHGVLALDGGPDRATDDATVLTEVFRSVHTVKGLAAMLEYEPIVALCHRLETILRALERGSLLGGQGVASHLVESARVLAQLLADVQFDRPLVLPVDLLDRLDRLLDATPTSAPFPRSILSVEERAEAPRASVIRVEIERLDELMRLVGELVVSRARIGMAVDALDRGSQVEGRFGLQEAAARLDRQLRDLREAVLRVRMVPIREAFARMPLVVRDAAHAEGRQARVELVGEDTELDKLLVDRLADPLLHLVRNAVDHGLESPDVRKARGKPEVGLIRLAARAEGDRVLVTVSDDGAGIDRQAVARRAAARGLNPREIQESDDALLEALCQPGLSTREQVGRTSGRGVGMDVVLQRVHEMNGTLEVRTGVGKGTTFTIRLPLTLAIVQVLTTSCAGQRFAFPLAVVDEVTEVAEQEVVGVEGNEIFQRHGEVLSLLRLNDAFHLPGQSKQDRFHALTTSVGGNRWAIGVDRLIGEQGVIVKSLADPLVRTPGVVGAADLGDGQLVLVLDVAELIRQHRSRRAGEGLKGE